MVRAVIKRSLKTHYRVACKNTLLDALAQALFNSREVSLWNCAADNSLGKLQILAVTRLKLNPNITELSVTARLLLVSALRLNLLADCFTIRYLWLLKGNINSEFVSEF